MSNSSQNSNISLLSGLYHGRVLEIISGKGKSQVSASKNNKYILVLIKDRLYTLNFQEDAELSKGVLISFEVSKKGGLVNLKSVAHVDNFEISANYIFG